MDFQSLTNLAVFEFAPPCSLPPLVENVSVIVSIEEADARAGDDVTDAEERDGVTVDDGGGDEITGGGG